MTPSLKKIHDFEVSKIQRAIRMKQLLHGVVLTRDMGNGKFDINVFLVPTTASDSIRLRIDPGQSEDDDRLTFDDLSV